MKTLCRCLSLLLLTSAAALAGVESAVIIKVNGSYGIINQGSNQGIADGQVFYVKRVQFGILKEIAQVKVIRTTPNRAAVEQTSSKANGGIEKGDKLYSDPNATVESPPDLTESQVASAPKPPRKETTRASGTKTTNSRNSGIEPITEPTRKDPEIASAVPKTRRSQPVDLRKPWLGLNVGTTFPTGDLSDIYSASLNVGFSYMVEAVNGFNMGVEVNKSFLGGSPTGANLIDGASINSSSILEGLVVFQKYFGRYFFIEGGGGIFRPQIRTMSLDNVESNFSSSNFGVFGGTGFFVPTSEYAGFSLRGRIHNYFDDTSRQYLGLAGGFRFKIH
jgi:hypothetical protein